MSSLRCYLSKNVGNGDKLHSQEQLIISIRSAVGVSFPPLGPGECWQPTGELQSWTGLLMSASASAELTFTSCCVSGDNKHINHPAVASHSDRCGRNRAESGQKTSCVTHQISPKTKGTPKIRRELVNIWCTATVMQEKLLWILNYIHYQIFQKLLLKYHLYDWLSFLPK